MRPRLEGERGERPRTSNSPGRNDPPRLDHLGRARALRRVDRAAGRCHRRQRGTPRRSELADLHRLVRGDRPDVPGGGGGGRPAARRRVEGVGFDRARIVLRPVRRRRPRHVLRARLSRRQAEIGGLALSTTSLAVVYAVLVETGLNKELVGKRLMSATFVTDIATVTGLTVLFLKPTVWIVPFALVSIGLIFGLPYAARHFFPRYGNRVIEPEIKLVFACLFLLMWLGLRANSQAAKPAFVLGLAMSQFFASHRLEQDRLRVVSFAFLTPFFFLKGGLNVSTSALWANLGILALLVAAKMGPKLLGVYPLARRFTAPHATFTTPLMSTGAHIRDDYFAVRPLCGDHRSDAVLAADRCRGALGDRPDRDRAALLRAAVGY